MDRIGNLRSFLAGRPDDRFARYSLAIELHKAGQIEEALAEMAELLRRHPTSGAGHYQHGQILLAAGRPAEAREAWAAGLKLLDGARADPEARRSIGEIERALDTLDSGEAD